MKKKVCIFTLYDSKGASSQYRILQFEKDMKKYFEVDCFPFWNDVYVTKYMRNKRKYSINIAIQYFVSCFRRVYQILFLATKCDVVFFQKACIPKIPINFISLLRSKKIKIIYDVDDAVYISKRDYSSKIAKEADVVICGNNTLLEYYQKKCNNCVFIPTVDNTYMYEKYYRQTFNNKIIGWIGSKTTISNLDIIVEPINYFMEKHSEVSFVIISDTAMDYTKKIKNSRWIEWKQEKYLSDLSTFSIGIMPLKNTEFNRGKCGFKLIQYLNMKKPVIGSDVGVNGDIIGNNGFLACTTEEWIKALEDLLFDEEIYNDCVKAIENNFFQYYHYEIIKDKLINLLDN